MNRKKQKERKKNIEKETFDKESKIIALALVLVISMIIVIMISNEFGLKWVSSESSEGKLSEALNYYDIGKRYYRENNLRMAIPNFQQAIKLSPDFYESYMKLAISFARLGEKQKAAKILESVIPKKPQELYNYYSNLALIYKDFDYKKSEKAFLKALELHPFPVNLYFQFGDFYWKQGKFEKAIENYKKGLKLYDFDFFYLGFVKRAINIFAQKPEEKFLRHILQSENIDNLVKKYDKSVFQKYYLANNRKIAEKYNQIGLYYQQKGKLDEANNFFKKSIQFWNSNKNMAKKYLQK